MKFKKVLPNSEKTRKFLNSLSTIYMVGFWARFGVREYPFTGQYTTDENGRSIPLIYHYEDDNGTCDEWRLMPITEATVGSVYVWTEDEEIANSIANALQIKNELNKKRREEKRKKEEPKDV